MDNTSVSKLPQYYPFTFPTYGRMLTLPLLSLFGTQFESGRAIGCVGLVLSVAFLRIKGLALTVAARLTCLR